MLLVYMMFTLCIQGCSARPPEPFMSPHAPSKAPPRQPTPDNGTPEMREWDKLGFLCYVFMLPKHLTSMNRDYIGATFPLYCGYLTLNKNGKPVFVKKTNYPTDNLDEFFKRLERNHNYLSIKEPYGFSGLYAEYASYGYIAPEFSRYYSAIKNQIYMNIKGLDFVTPEFDYGMKYPTPIIDDNYVPQFNKTCTLTGTDPEADKACLKMELPGSLEDYIKEDYPPKLFHHAIKQEKKR